MSATPKPMLEQQQSTDPEWLQRIIASLVAIIALLGGVIARMKRKMAVGPGISREKALTLIRQEIRDEERWRQYDDRLKRMERVFEMWLTSREDRPSKLT